MVQQKRQSQDKQQQQLDQLASCWSDVVASYQKAYDFFLFLYFYLKSRISTWSLELGTWNLKLGTRNRQTTLQSRFSRRQNKSLVYYKLFHLSLEIKFCSNVSRSRYLFTTFSLVFSSAKLKIKLPQDELKRHARATFQTILIKHQTTRVK